MTRLRELRQRQGRTIAELAMRLGVAEGTVRNWEQGRHLPQSGRMRRKIAKALNVSEAHLEFGPTTTATTDELKPLAAGIIVRDHRVLMTERLRHEHGQRWSWPSGKVERGESLEEALLRELYEELVIADAYVIRHLGDIDLTSGYRMSVFLTAIPADAEPQLNDYEQLARIIWMTRDEIEQALETPPDVKRQALDLVDQALSDTTTIVVTTTPAARRARRRTPGAEHHTG
jgi:8-oxo-dGTP pyrophosphatase MutT (NUDIX family)